VVFVKTEKLKTIPYQPELTLWKVETVAMLLCDFVFWHTEQFLRWLISVESS